MPNQVCAFFVTPLALSDQSAASRAQEVPQWTIKLRRHSSGVRFSLAQRGYLKKHRGGIEPGMIVRQQIKGHCRYLFQQLIKRRRIGGSGDVIAVASPNRSLAVP